MRGKEAVRRDVLDAAGGARGARSQFLHFNRLPHWPAVIEAPARFDTIPSSPISHGKGWLPTSGQVISGSSERDHEVMPRVHLVTSLLLTAPHLNDNLNLFQRNT